MLLEQSINQFWDLCRTALDDHFTFDELPSNLSELIKQYAEKKAKQKDVKIVARVIGDKDAQKQNKAATEVLKLFDASVNGYRSATNVLLEFLKLQQGFDKGLFDLNIGQYVSINGIPIYDEHEIQNAKRCPICNRFPQENKGFALISGGPQTDSSYQTYRNSQETATALKYAAIVLQQDGLIYQRQKLLKMGRTFIRNEIICSLQRRYQNHV